MKHKYKSARGEFTDDWGINCHEMRYLPTGGGGNILCSLQSFNKEIEFRKSRIKTGVNYELPKWEDLKIYSAE